MLLDREKFINIEYLNYTKKYSVTVLEEILNLLKNPILIIVQEWVHIL